MERAATFVWYGPFVLQGKRGEPAEMRLREIANFSAATRGLYLVVGAMRRALIRQDRIVYVGRAARSFLECLSEKLAEDDGTLRKIEEGGAVSSIWLAAQGSYDSLCLDAEAADGDPRETGGPAELPAYENLLIHTALRSQNDLPLLAADHANRSGFTPPSRDCVMINRFNTDSWNHKRRPKWRPTMIPDIIDCHVGANGSSLAQLIWTGTRGVAMQRRECRPGRLQAAPKSRPHGGLRPTL